jgi:hypothetical protein
MEERDVLPSRLGLSCQALAKVDIVELGVKTYMAVTGPGINAGRGESDLSEKGENAEIRALADDGGLRGERTAIIMATHATVQFETLEVQVTELQAPK